MRWIIPRLLSAVCLAAALAFCQENVDSGSAPLPTNVADDAAVGGAAVQPPVAAYIAPVAPQPAKAEPRFDWVPALKQSLFFLTIQHSFRFATEPGTRAELKGPFFKDWYNSIRGYNGWKDGDPAIVNYVGHPMMGSITGFIELQNERDGKSLTFGSSSAYWKSRGRAMAFSAVYSAFFEIGPLSEASLGNVGLEPKTSGMVDVVVTPTIGTAWLITEDIVDRYILVKLEGKIKNRPVKIFLRGLLNPSRSFANMMAGHEPWKRYDRGGLWRNQP